MEIFGWQIYRGKENQSRSHEKLISTAGWSKLSKLDFTERDKYNPVLLRHSLAGNLYWNFLTTCGG
jgi:hypothetical protein